MWSGSASFEAEPSDPAWSHRHRQGASTVWAVFPWPILILVYERPGRCIRGKTRVATVWRAASAIQDAGANAGKQIYSRQIVCSSSGDQNLSRDRHVLHRQPAYCSMACVRTGCHAGTCRHQHARDGAAHSSGREQFAHCVFMR